MSKFKVGDRVVVTRKGSWGEIGDSGIIECLEVEDCTHRVKITKGIVGSRMWIPEIAMRHDIRDCEQKASVKAKESDRKEVAKAIREIQECLNEALKECQVVGIDVSLSVEGLELKVDMTHTPDKRSY